MDVRPLGAVDVNVLNLPEDTRAVGALKDITEVGDAGLVSAIGVVERLPRVCGIGAGGAGLDGAACELELGS